ncbi:MAG: Holliday junction branch migration protein RuvA, partial [Lachnospiraceae bacterium]
GVSGVGPKAALGVLSVLTADDVRFAVLSDDSKTIARAPGIGPKTAKKIILELKDRLSLEDAFEHRLSQNRQEDDVLPPAMNPQDEAVQALAALGYSAAESLRAVRSLEDTEGMDTETILKMALKKLSRF